MIENVDLEKKRLRNAYATLLRACKPIVYGEGKKTIRKAFNFALEAHQGVRRKSGELYIYHPLSVAIICAKEIGLGTTSIVCALLHDVVEDTEVTLEDIEAIFGEKVVKIIDGLTKISGFIGTTRSIQAENFRKIILTLAEDVRVILIKLADRLHNMRTLDAVSKQSQLKIASETLELFAPLAHRLGLYMIKTELEDLSLKYTEPVIYQELDTKLKSAKDQISKFIRVFIRPVQESLNNHNLKYEVRGRLKSIYSIYNKMKVRNITFEQVYDIFAIRIIIDGSINEKTECWRVYSIVTDFYRPNPERLRDWLSTPKVNGYESLHTTVMGHKGKWVEVQIRTRRMDDIAEKGYAAHYKYKQGESSETSLDGWIRNVGELLKDTDNNALDFFDEFKLNLFEDEVFVFTPKGDMITLPANATPLDLAFNIHTDVGLRYLGAKVNNKLVPQSLSLRNGDQIEIITSKKQKPTQDWLNFVVTAKAKSAIKQSLKEERRIITRQGKNLLVRKLQLAKFETENKDINLLIGYFQLSSEFELFFNIGSNKINVTDLNSAIKILKINTEPDKKTKPEVKKSYQEIISDKPGIILVGENHDFNYSFSKCCNPIPGDEIFGFVTIGEGIKIHRTNCPKGIKLMSNYGFRIVEAKWASPEIIEVDYFSVGLKLTGIDMVGIINRITSIITKEMKINMRSIDASTLDGSFEGSIIVDVFDTEQLESLIRNIVKVEGVESVTRFHVEEAIDKK